MRGYGMIDVDQAGWIEKEPPQAGPLDALVRPMAVAPCTSDVHLLHGGGKRMQNRILGHEAVGEVVEVGSLVERFKPGDLVAVPCSTPDWGATQLQRRGSNNAHDRGLQKSFKFAMQKDGVFAELFSVNDADANLARIPEGVSIEDALMCVDMMSTGFYGAELADVQFGDSVVVFGIGPVGLMAVAGAALRGAGRLIAVGSRPNCAQLAREFGATDVVDYREGDVVSQIRSMEGRVDACIIAGGGPSCINEALALTRAGGTIASIMFYDAEDQIEFGAREWGLGMGDITLRSGFCPGGAYRIERLLKVVQAGRVHPGGLLNRRFEGFDAIEEAFALMEEKPRDLVKPYVFIEW